MSILISNLLVPALFYFQNLKQKINIVLLIQVLITLVLLKGPSASSLYIGYIFLHKNKGFKVLLKL